MQAAPALHMSAILYQWLQCWNRVVYNGEKYSCPVCSKNWVKTLKNSMSVINIQRHKKQEKLIFTYYFIISLEILKISALVLCKKFNKITVRNKEGAIFSMLQEIIILISMFSSTFNIMSFALTVTRNSSEFLLCEVLCWCHLLQGIFILFIIVTFLILSVSLPSWSVSGCISRVQATYPQSRVLRQQGQSPLHHLCLQVLHVCSIKFSFPMLSCFVSLPNFHFC